jgi:hypothetical protein
MKFTVKSTKQYFHNTENIEPLQSIGFKFSSDLYKGFFHIISDIEIEINSLEELVKLSNTFNMIIVYGNVIEIYNSHRE